MNYKSLLIELIDYYESKYLLNGKAWEYAYKFMSAKLKGGLK